MDGQVATVLAETGAQAQPFQQFGIFEQRRRVRHHHQLVLLKKKKHEPN